MPTIVAHAFAVKRHYYDNESLYLHRPQEGLSVAENFLYSVRHDNQYTAEEARLLDLCLVLHAEHGGGNNSAFTCRVLSSSGTDFYSAIAAAVGSLKGPRHGGANKKVMEMFGGLEADVKDWANNRYTYNYLARLLRKEAGDRSGLIYGIGHAIYTLSDPRAVVLKRFARKLAESKGMLEEFELFERVERLAPEVLLSVKGEEKVVCANVDFYSGLVYKMIGHPHGAVYPSLRRGPDGRLVRPPHRRGLSARQPHHPPGLQGRGPHAHLRAPGSEIDREPAGRPAARFRAAGLVVSALRAEQPVEGVL